MFESGVNIPGIGVCTTPFEVLFGNIDLTARRYRVKPIGRLYTDLFAQLQTFYWELHLWSDPDDPS